MLGCLVEKEATVPDTYPLTLNSLRTACNQSTSRDPVVSYGEPEIEAALRSLRERGLTRTVHSTSNRATKFRHVLPEALELSAAELALLSVLMLRGAQTVGELKSRAERQRAFRSTDAVELTLTAMATRLEPLVLQLERRPGQKDARWVHLLAAAGDTDDHDQHDRDRGSSSPDHALHSVEDPYGVATAEFYDLLGSHLWDELGLVLLDVFAELDPSAGPIVDVGCGTGVGLEALHAAAPECAVFAIEPSRAMRVGLHARLHLDRRLAELVTVSPFALADTALPGRAAAVIVSAAYGHLTHLERLRLWSYVATALAPGAPAVIGVLPPDRPTDVPLTRYASVPVGTYVYEGWQSGSPVDERRMRWDLRYRVVDRESGKLLVEHRAEGIWQCDSVDDVAAEIAPFGLELEPRDGCVVVRRPVG